MNTPTLIQSMGSLLIQYKNLTSRPPSLSLILFLSLNTHFSSIFPSPNLSPFHPFFPDYADLELVRVSNLCLILFTDKNGSALIKMAVQKEPQRDSDYIDLSLSVSFSFSVFVDEVGVINF